MNKYTDHKLMRWRVTVPCSDCLQGCCALEVAQLWALWDCGVQSLPLWALQGPKQK